MVAWAAEELSLTPIENHQSKLRSSQFKPSQEVITITPAATGKKIHLIVL